MSVRVVAGSFRGRVLSTPHGSLTRPTASRVREAMFSILGSVAGARVLDLYAGSGALGIEALSRGAERAAFVECERKALACLRDNVERLGLADRARVVAERVESSARTLRSGERFDLVFCDPPWKLMARALSALEQLCSSFASDARVVLEHPAAFEAEVPGLRVVDTRRWGDTGATFFELQSG
jgi:16S rRNA (guanine(966)-N(2))-methyltransferase RsmD